MNDEAVEPSAADEVVREWRLYTESVDPIAQAVLAAEGPLDAYEAANAFSGVLIDHLTWLPQGGAVYVAWAEATDLYEIGDVSPGTAHGVLRQMASHWLTKPSEPSDDFLRNWVATAQSAIADAATPD